MDPGHLSRLEMQLSSALGDDTGKKLRILQQAIQVRFESLALPTAVLYTCISNPCNVTDSLVSQRLIHDRTYPPLPRSPREAERAPADPEWVRRQATLVRRYRCLPINTSIDLPCF